MKFKRKAQAASAMTWFVAFIIIFFVIIFFTGTTLTVARAKSLPVISWIVGGKSTIGVEQHSAESLSIERKFEVFLNSPIKMGNDAIAAKNVFANGINADLSADFKKEADYFINELASSSAKDSLSGMWLRVYNAGDAVSKDYSGGNGAYNAYLGTCNPNDANSFVIREFATSTKQIVLCVEYR